MRTTHKERPILFSVPLIRAICRDFVLWRWLLVAPLALLVLLPAGMLFLICKLLEMLCEVLEKVGEAIVPERFVDFLMKWAKHKKPMGEGRKA